MVLKSFHTNMIWEGKQVSRNSSVLYQKRAVLCAFPLGSRFTSVVPIGSWSILSPQNPKLGLLRGGMCLGSSSLFLCNQEMPGDLLREDSLNQWLGCKATTTPILLSSISTVQFWSMTHNVSRSFPAGLNQLYTPCDFASYDSLACVPSPLPISLLPHLFFPGNTS